MRKIKPPPPPPPTTLQQQQQLLPVRVVLLEELVAVHNPAIHDTLHIFHRPSAVREVPHPVLGHHHVVLKAHPTETSKPNELLGHKKGRHLRVGERLVQQVIDEINPGLDGDRHARGEVPSAAESRVSRSRVPGPPPLRVAAHVVRVYPDEVAEAVGHEHRANVSGEHVVHGALQDPRRQEPLAGYAVG